MASGAVAPVMAQALTLMMQARLNFLISGATGTGKTTLLSTLLGLASPQERLVLVEDAAVTPAWVAATLPGLANDADRLARMGHAAAALVPRDADERLARIVMAAGSPT